MAFSFLYKRLCEVHLYHGHFLDAGDGTPFYDRPELERNQVLDNYDVWKWLEIEPTAESRRLMSKYRLVFKPTRRGFMLGIEVQPDQLGDGTLIYLPLIPPETAVKLHFNLKEKGITFDSITGTCLRTPVSARYYFSNDWPENTQTVSIFPTFPSFAFPYPEYEPHHIYEMGAFVRHNGQLFQALLKTETEPVAGNVDWELINDNHRYISDADRMLLPSDFDYRFPSAPGINHAIFTLRAFPSIDDAVGEELYREEVKKEQPIKSHFLNLKAFDKGKYRLDIEGMNTEDTSITYLDHKEIYLYDELYKGRTGNAVPRKRTGKSVGSVEIVPFINRGPFRLLEIDGHLRTEQAGNEQVTMHPVFQLRFPARSTYWLYRYNQDLPQPSDGDVAHYSGARNLLSLSPRPLLQARSEIHYIFEVLDDNGDPVQEKDILLPNPGYFFLKECDQGRKVCSEVSLPPLKLD